MANHETQNSKQQKRGIIPWLYAILGMAASIGSVVAAVSAALRWEIVSCAMFLLICAPVFGFISVAFGWKEILPQKNENA